MNLFVTSDYAYIEKVIFQDLATEVACSMVKDNVTANGSERVLGIRWSHGIHCIQD